MTEYESADEKRTDVDKRTRRAATEPITLVENAPGVEGADGLYLAVSHTANDYVVDARLCTCECPDYEYREPEGGCKHLRRLKLIKGELGLPEEIPEEDLHGRIGIGISDGRTTEGLLEARARPNPGSSAKAVADGGIVVADDDGEVLEDDVVDDESEDCDCSTLPGDYPCAACYVAGDVEWPEEGA